MAAYLISFPASAMDVAPEDLPAVGEAALAVVREAQEAGVLLFSGGLDDEVAPALVDADGTVTADLYPESADLSGGFCVLELESRERALAWAAKLAEACRCPQELRRFGPGSLP